MNQIEKYISVVTAHIREQQREEIEKELRANINDMLDERCGDRTPSKEEVDEVLLELGDPKKLAENYKGTPRYLIGENLYPTYCKILKIALTCVLIATAIGAVTTFATEQDLQVLLESVLSIPGGLISAFGSVTLIFAIFERNEVKFKKDMLWKEEPWNPNMLDKQLQQEPAKQSFKNIFEIAFHIILLLAINLFPEKLGFYYHIAGTGKYDVITLFNMPELMRYLWIINVILVLSILYHCIRFIIGRQSLGLLISHAVLKFAECIQLILIFRFPGVWNVNLLDELNSNNALTLNGSVSYQGIGEGMDIFVAVIVVLSAIEIGKEIYAYVKKYTF